MDKIREMVYNGGVVCVPAWKRKHHPAQIKYNDGFTAPVRFKIPKSYKRNEPCPCGSGMKFKRCGAVKLCSIHRMRRDVSKIRESA